MAVRTPGRQEFGVEISRGATVNLCGPGNMTRVVNQTLNTNISVAVATSAAVSYALVRDGHGLYELSSQELVNNLPITRVGSLPLRALGYAASFGLCLETEFPFSAQHLPLAMHSLTPVDHKVFIQRPVKIFDVQGARAALDDGHALISSVPLYQSFYRFDNVNLSDRQREEVYVPRENDFNEFIYHEYHPGIRSFRRIKHYVLIVGYGGFDAVGDEVPNPYFIIKNSLGVNWGIHGYGKVSVNCFAGVRFWHPDSAVWFNSYEVYGNSRTMARLLGHR